MGKRDSSKSNSTIYKLFSYAHHHIQAINNSKIFAGLMIITLNIVSKFVNIKLSKTMESYLKFTFSRQILVFAIAWMGTRDIYIALFITIVFVIVTEFLFHEESMFFVFPEEFRDRHIEMLENEGNDKDVTDEDVRKATEVLEKAKKQNKMSLEYQSYAMK
jgi:uncharacterized membrane protein